MRVLTDPAECGPVTLALPQDVQAEAYDYLEAFFARVAGEFGGRLPIRRSSPMQRPQYRGRAHR